jgi:hypothetical protein
MIIASIVRLILRLVKGRGQGADAQDADASGRSRRARRA